MRKPILAIPPRRVWFVPRRVLLRRARGCAVADLQFVCSAGPYELDVLVREYPEHLEFIGQVTWGSRIYEPVPELEVTLIDADSVSLVKATSTNLFGEFDLQSPGDCHYGLRLGRGDPAPCVSLWEEEALA